MSTGSPDPRSRNTVLHVVDGLGLSGKTRNLVSLATQVDRRRFAPVVCTLGDESSPLRGQLDAAGVPFCKGGVMAKNRAWRKSVADWRTTVDAWVRRQRPEDLLNVDIFFQLIVIGVVIVLAVEAYVLRSHLEGRMRTRAAARLS